MNLTGLGFQLVCRTVSQVERIASSDRFSDRLMRILVQALIA